MQFILCLVYIPVDTSKYDLLISYHFRFISSDKNNEITVLSIYCHTISVLTRVTGFNGHSDYRSSVKVQITEGSTHQRAGYCG